jgi:hypothetical protein
VSEVWFAAPADSRAHHPSVPYLLASAAPCGTDKERRETTTAPSLGFEGVAIPIPSTGLRVFRRRRLAASR